MFYKIDTWLFRSSALSHLSFSRLSFSPFLKSPFLKSLPFSCYSFCSLSIRSINQFNFKYIFPLFYYMFYNFLLNITLLSLPLSVHSQIYLLPLSKYPFPQIFPSIFSLSLSDTFLFLNYFTFSAINLSRILRVRSLRTICTHCVCMLLLHSFYHSIYLFHIACSTISLLISASSLFEHVFSYRFLLFHISLSLLVFFSVFLSQRLSLSPFQRISLSFFLNPSLSLTLLTVSLTQRLSLSPSFDSRCFPTKITDYINVFQSPRPVGDEIEKSQTLTSENCFLCLPFKVTYLLFLLSLKCLTSSSLIISNRWNKFELTRARPVL